MTPTTYQHHVDARYYNFLWPDASYITVEYLTDGEKVSIQNITAPPYLLSAVMLYGGWHQLMAEIQQSAEDHAEKERSDSDREDNTATIGFMSLYDHFK